MSPAKSENANRAEKRDHRREVTDSIIKMLEDGVAPWQKPWEGSAMPFNPNDREAVPWRQRPAPPGNRNGAGMRRSAMDDLQAGRRTGLAGTRRRKRDSYRVLGGEGAFKRERRRT